MPKRAIYSDKVFKGSLPFAQVTVAGGFMFVCCVGRDRAGNWAVGDVRKQTQQCLDNIRALIGLIPKPRDAKPDAPVRISGTLARPRFR